MLESKRSRLLVLIFCSCLFIVCDTLAANWGKTGSIASLVTVILLAPFSYITFGYLNQKYPLAVVSSWVILALCVSSVVIGIFYFDDQLTSQQGIGVLLAIVAVALMAT